MSKYQAPAPPGQPTHPAKILVRGPKPGSSEQRSLLSRYEPAIRHFHMKHQQQVKLSGNPQYKASQQWGDEVRATYENNNGQERLTIELSVAAVEREKEPVEREVKVTSPEYWDWAIIDFDMPSLNLTNASLLAVASGVDVTEISDEAEYPPQGVTVSGGWVVQEYPPIIAFAGDIGHGVIPYYVDDIVSTGQRLSLRVDLRGFHVDGGVLLFDLYGYVNAYREERLPEPGETVVSAILRGISGPTSSGARSDFFYSLDPPSGETLGGVEIWVKLGTAADLAAAGYPGAIEGKTTSEVRSHGKFMNSCTYSGGAWLSGDDPNSWLAQFGSNVWDGTPYLNAAGDSNDSTDWVITYWAPGVPKTKVLQMRDADVPSPPSDGTYLVGGFDRTELWCPIVYATPEAECSWSWRLFKGKPADAASRHRHDDNDPATGLAWELYYWQWEDSELYPDRWELTPVDEPITIPRKATAESEYPSIREHYGMTKIGTFSVNPALIGGGVAFTPA